nr:NUDIX hydrolase domain-like motif-containing protein [Pandoravirus massiliensis]
MAKATSALGPYAGVLPWARVPGTGEVVVLLGQERFEPGWRDGGRWSDFGGGTEPDVDRDPIEAAAREAYEETMGMLGSRAEVETALRAAAQAGRLHRARSPKGASVFLWEVPYDPMLPIQFARVRAYALEAAAAHDKAGAACGRSCATPAKGYYEKRAVEWVPAAVLADIVADALPVAETRARGLVPQRDPGLLRDDFARTVAPFFARAAAVVHQRPALAGLY